MEVAWGRGMKSPSRRGRVTKSRESICNEKIIKVRKGN